MRKLLTAAFLLIISLSVILIQIQSVQRGRASFLENVFTTLLSPAEKLFFTIGRGSKNLWDRLFSASSPAEEIEVLKRENRALKTKVDSSALLERENENLRGLLNLAQNEKSGIPAEVIAWEATNWFCSITLNRGTKDGVQKEMIAVCPEGLVGRVTHAGYSTCQVRLITNHKSAVPVCMIETGAAEEEKETKCPVCGQIAPIRPAGTGALGVLYGEGKDICRLRFVEITDKIEEGNLVITSGMGEIFPGGIVVGRVEKVAGSRDGLFKEAQIRPAVNFRGLKLVMIVGKAK